MSCVSWLVTLFGVALGSESNLNGDYVLSETPGARQTAQKFPKHFSDYPRKPMYFDVYSPTIKTLYSQVFWKSLPPVDIPEDIVKRFDGKGMAVVGFEIDQVRRTDKGDVSVPITVAYNHHFESTMIGKAASFEREELQGPNDPRAHGAHGHGAPLNWRPGDEHWVVREPEKAGDLPHSQAFGGANGGEFRKSFHGYAPGFVQVIQSPTQMQITPMQIDTWHREKMNISHPSRFVSGPVPRTSLAPTTGPDALYSGLLECPLTTRITKHVQSTAKIHIGTPCSSEVTSGDECMEIARGLLSKHRFAPLQRSQEVGCFIAGDTSEFDLVHVSFKAPHGREAFALHQELRGRRPTPQALCGSDAQRFLGNSNPLVNVSVDLDLLHDVATISLQGPKDVWFGVGFNALTMSDQPWAIIVDGNGEVTERKLGYHQPGTLLKPSVTVVESKVVGSLRSVLLTRSVKGASPDYYTFKPLDGTEINFINAVGSGPTLSYHQHRTIGQLTLLPVAGASGASGACLCKGAPVAFGDAKGTMEYTASGAGDEGSGSVAFNNHCAPQPRSDLLAMKNPTCDLRNYSGGQIACHHMWSLLDADQSIPWTDQPLEYSLKFRFWVEDYDETYHTMLRRVTWGIASPVEYDVPKCAEGVMGCSMENGTWIHTIHGTFTGEGHLAAAHFHCHAPTCLSMQMYRCPLGTKVCNATTGTLLCEERPRYGHGEDDFGEPGYILQPPCLWGSSDFGLEAPPSVEGYVLGAVKTSNASYGHHGEMAWQQMYIFDKHASENYV